MNKIGLIFAMKEELEAALKYMNKKNEYKLFDLLFYECECEGKECALVECGIGKVNAARCSQILIDNIEVDYIINVGVAGGVSKKVNICDVVIGYKLIQHDFDLRPFNYERGRKFGVDRLDNAETAGVAFGRLGAEFTRTKAVPELDAFTFAQIAGTTGISKATAGTYSTGADWLAALVTAQSKMDNDEVPTEGRILYITPDGYNAIHAVDTVTDASGNESDDTVLSVLIRREQFDGRTVMEIW